MSSDYKQRGQFSKQFTNSLSVSPRKEILDYVVNTDTGLDIQLRGGYINIYYKGGNILRIKPQSYEFDCFYFYKDCKKEDRATRKTIILDAAKGKKEAVNLISKDKANDIIVNLEKQRDDLLGDVEKDPKRYFERAKEVIDEWLRIQKSELGIAHDEKNTQHLISLQNKNFSGNDLVVIDLEYAISQKAKFAKPGSNPRPDIIAMDKDGRVHVMELKYGLGAIHGKSGIQNHIKDFNETIGKDPTGEFLKEMAGVVDMKEKLGIQSHGIKVDTDHAPIFDVVLKGTRAEYNQLRKEFDSILPKESSILLLEDKHDLKLKFP